jgi:hypothetical protein
MDRLDHGAAVVAVLPRHGTPADAVDEVLHLLGCIPKRPGTYFGQTG